MASTCCPCQKPPLLTTTKPEQENSICNCKKLPIGPRPPIVLDSMCDKSICSCPKIPLALIKADPKFLECQCSEMLKATPPVPFICYNKKTPADMKCPLSEQASKQDAKKCNCTKESCNMLDSNDRVLKFKDRTEVNIDPNVDCKTYLDNKAKKKIVNGVVDTDVEYSINTYKPRKDSALEETTGKDGGVVMNIYLSCDQPSKDTKKICKSIPLNILKIDDKTEQGSGGSRKPVYDVTITLKESEPKFVDKNIESFNFPENIANIQGAEADLDNINAQKKVDTSKELMQTNDLKLPENKEKDDKLEISEVDKKKSSSDMNLPKRDERFVKRSGKNDKLKGKMNKTENKRTEDEFEKEKNEEKTNVEEKLERKKSIKKKEYSGPEVYRMETSSMNSSIKSKSSTSKVKLALKQKAKKKKGSGLTKDDLCDLQIPSDFIRGIHPGCHAGHSTCCLPIMYVPGNMGWLWNLCDGAGIIKPGLDWKPGAINATVAYLMSQIGNGTFNPSRARIIEKPKKVMTDTKVGPQPPIVPALQFQRTKDQYLVGMNPNNEFKKDKNIANDDNIVIALPKSAISSSTSRRGNTSTDDSLEIDFITPDQLNKQKAPMKALSKSMKLQLY